MNTFVTIGQVEDELFIEEVSAMGDSWHEEYAEYCAAADYFAGRMDCREGKPCDPFAGVQYQHGYEFEYELEQKQEHGYG